MMIDIDLRQILPVFLPMKYVNERAYQTDYSNSPRPFYSLAIMNKGSANVHFDNQTIRVNTNDVFLIPKSATYQGEWFPEGRVEVFTVHFDFSPQWNLFRNQGVKIQKINVPEMESYKETFEEIYKKQFEEPRLALLSVFLKYLSIILPSLKARSFGAEYSSVKPAIEYLEMHDAQSIRIEKLASLCALSPSRFFAVFKKATGFSPIAYRNKILCERVAQSILSEKDKTVEELADEYHFSSSIYLRRLFRKYYGTSPTKYKITGKTI